MNRDRLAITACMAVATLLAAIIVSCSNSANPGVRQISPIASASPAAR